MNFDLTEEQQQIRNLASDLAQKELAPKAMEIDRTQAFPHNGLNKLAEVGLMGMGIPQDFGGSKSDYLSLVLVMEEIAKVCPSTAEILACHLEASFCITAGSSDDAKRKYLASLASGEKLGTFAFTEAGCGCGTENSETRSRADGEYYVVNGSKVFVTSGEEADIYLTMVRTDPQQPGPDGQSLLLVEKGTSGFSFGSKYERMGLRGTSPRELIFEDCRVPRSNLLGAQMQIMPITGGGEQLATSAISLGIAQVALEASIKYAKERLQVGRRPLTQYQAVRHMLVDMSTLVDVARAFVYRAAVNLDSRTPGMPIDCFKAKLFATEMAVEVTDKALQIHGGTGYCCDLPVERYYRDARGLTLHAKPTEAHRDLLSMFLLA